MSLVEKLHTFIWVIAESSNLVGGNSSKLLFFIGLVVPIEGQFESLAIYDDIVI